MPDPHTPLAAELAAARGETFDDAAGVEHALAQCVAKAREAWPDVRLDTAAFVRAVADVSKGADIFEDLTALNAPDLFLARACLAGDGAAQRAFARLHLARVREWVAHVDRSEAFAEDVRQEASRRLLLHEEGAKLGGYSGRGALGAFVRVFVTRLARKMKRRKAETPYVDPPEVLEAHDMDPEVALLRRRFAKEFSDAFRATLATLDADERNVLKLHYLDGLSIEEVGAAYRVSRATAARWLAKAKTRIVEETQRLLSDRLGHSAPRAASLLALVQSQLDASLMKYLRR